MSKMLVQSIISSSLLRILLLVSSAVVAYLMLPFLSHNLGVRDYGIWAVAISVIGYYGFLDLGVSSAVGRFVGKAYGQDDFEQINKVTTTSVAIFTLISLVGIGLSIIGAFISQSFMENPEEAKNIFYVILFLGIGFSTQFPVRAVAGIVYAAVDHRIIVISEMVKLFIKTTLIVYVITQGHGLIHLAVSVAFAEIFGNVFQCLFVFHKFPKLKLRLNYISKDVLSTLFGYSWVAFIARLSEMLNTKSLPILVSYLIGVEFVVFYVVALRLMEYINQFISTMTSIFAPIVSRFEDNIQHLKSTYEHASRVVLFISLYLGSSIAFYSKWLIPLWMGDGFNDSYVITLMLCVPFMMMGVQKISREVLFGISKHKYCAIINVVEFILFIILGTIFGQLYSYYGIAFGFALAIMIGEIMFPAIVSRALSLNVFKVYFDVFVVPAVRVMIPLALFFMFANRYVESTYLSLIKWNLIQAGTLMPVLYFILPVDIRKSVFGFIENRVTKIRGMVVSVFG